MLRVIRRIAKFMSILIALALVLCGLAVAGFMYFNAPPDSAAHPLAGDNTLRIDSDGALFLEVRSGETSLSVGNRLQEAGIIRNRYFWQVLSRYKKDYIKTGSYRIELPASQIAIHSLLVAGDQILVRVTIPEGVTLKKTARIMEESGICPGDAFIEAASSPGLLNYYHIPNKTLEGYLYPDTYLFPLSYPAEKVAAQMADNFYSRLSEAAPEALNMSAGELNDRVILASIVEREYRVNQEAAIMAGVFLNRLKIGMALQSCATVEYVITEIQGRPHPEVLYNRDIEIRDPYNTYIRPGLPPGPISAPGRVALDAAFHPVPSDFLYFRLVDAAAGSHYFSRTLDDHIKAGALYLKGSAR
ncbi:endolytic transglycosylase MltG [Leadbettera azotonutricia]|uniref:Endolytic murein transglycosylase n=1 Tax=Leadbettera azotonutricia (strain ATCC BAA-888 / DSM 13862 / ZAS-9) TaxID=545695 RepID=F5YC89_LEAAZ|nr:endolytic transglycosylase MltG [Leadbettera azotonutricia]AEF83473.1 aminodeoxychorismate lyase [Leadbettera azotonutricia ZAS-9]